MKKKTEEVKPQENGMAMTKEPRHPAEMEADRLRIQLKTEQIKVNALSRRCIQLGEELEAAKIANDNRVEQDMFSRINGNCDHIKAVKAASNRKSAHAKKMAEFYSKTLEKHAGYLFGEVVVTVTAILFGFFKFAHPVLAIIVSAVSLIAFGWSLNNCVYLIGRCAK